MEALPMIFAAIPAISSGVGLVENLMGGGKSAAAPAPPSSKPVPTSTITGTAVAPSTSPGDFTKSQEAYWNQLFSGLGMGENITPDIQQNIQKQAGLLG